MTFNELVKKNLLNSKSLSKQSNVPIEIIEDLMNGIVGMEEQAIKIALRIAKALNFTLEDMLVELELVEKLFVRFRSIEQKVNFVENYKNVHGENILELVDVGYPSEWYYIDKRNFKPVCYYCTDEELRRVL